MSVSMFFLICNNKDRWHSSDICASRCARERKGQSIINEGDFTEFIQMKTTSFTKQRKATKDANVNPMMNVINDQRMAFLEKIVASA